MGGECDSCGRGDNCLSMLVGALVGKMLEVTRGKIEIDLKEILRT